MKGKTIAALNAEGKPSIRLTIVDEFSDDGRDHILMHLLDRLPKDENGLLLVEVTESEPNYLYTIHIYPEETKKMLSALSSQHLETIYRTAKDILGYNNNEQRDTSTERVSINEDLTRLPWAHNVAIIYTLFPHVDLLKRGKVLRYNMTTYPGSLSDLIMNNPNSTIYVHSVRDGSVSAYIDKGVLSPKDLLLSYNGVYQGRPMYSCGSVTYHQDQDRNLIVHSVKETSRTPIRRKNTIDIRATFIGESSLGYKHGEVYYLKLREHNGMTIERVDGSGKCEYSTIYTFLSNWKIIDNG